MIATLKALASAATPGPWVPQCNESQRSWKRGWWVQSNSDEPHDDPAELCSEADAHFIATANPQTVLALITVAEVALRLADSPGAQYGDPQTRDAKFVALVALANLNKLLGGS